MTPERIEEIKNTADESWFAADKSRGLEAHLRSEVFSLCDGTNDLLSALEEVEQQNERLREQIVVGGQVEVHIKGDLFKTKRDLSRVLAALEEARQQLAEEKKWRAVEHEVAGGYHRELVEAQQTIARQREALEKIEEELTDDTTERAQQINAIIGAALGEGAEA